MYDKFRALDITRLYLNKYDELKKLLTVQGEGMSAAQEEDILKLDNLINIYIEPTNRCNFNCSFCFR